MAFSTYHIDYLDRTSFYNEQQTVNLSQTNWLSPNPQSLHSLQIITLTRFGGKPKKVNTHNPTEWVVIEAIID